MDVHINKISLPRHSICSGFQKNRLTPRNDCCHSVQAIFSFYLSMKMNRLKSVRLWFYIELYIKVQKVKVSKAISVTGRGGLWGCELLRIAHCLDNWLTVNCEILATCSSTYSPVRTSQEAHSFSIK
jgi:hypothetical protein